MTPKEKAQDLVDEYFTWYGNEEYFSHEFAKECALIAIEQVRFFHESLFYATEGSLFDDYLNKVKHEIEKL